MPRKCHDCKETKNLKSGWVDDDDGLKECSFCCKCFFDNEYCNDEVSHVTRENWNDHDYHWLIKRQVTLRGNR